MYVSDDGKWFFDGDTIANPNPRPVRTDADLAWIEARTSQLYRTRVKATLTPERDAAGLKGVVLAIESGFGPMHVPGYVSPDGTKFLNGIALRLPDGSARGAQEAHRPVAGPLRGQAERLDHDGRVRRHGVRLLPLPGAADGPAPRGEPQPLLQALLQVLSALVLPRVVHEGGLGGRLHLPVRQGARRCSPSRSRSTRSRPS